MRFVKDWALPIAMLVGLAVYLLVHSLGLPVEWRQRGIDGIGVLQPVLIFSMLFITFCKIDIHELRVRWWHVAGVVFQCVTFVLLAVLWQFADEGWKVIVEGLMVCVICPTATAAAVVTHKLGGNAAGLATYTVMINIATAIVVALVVPIMYPQEDVGFITDFSLIISKVMPLLFLPIVAALAVRHWFKAVPRWLKRYPDLAFYLWCFALVLAIIVTVRSIANSDYDIGFQVGIALSSLLACTIQFAFGRWLGKRYDDATCITAGQSLGQKNTVFSIWMGYTFFTPVTSIAGGFYCVWHNLYNAWQLRKRQ